MLRSTKVAVRDDIKVLKCCKEGRQSKTGRKMYAKQKKNKIKHENVSSAQIPKEALKLESEKKNKK